MQSGQGRPAKVGLIGFGEAASAFVEGWRKALSLEIAALDIKTAAPLEAVRAAKWKDYSRWGVTGAETPAGALAGAKIVFSLVTADQALIAAEGAAPHLEPGAFYFDCNSCSPGTKRHAAEAVAKAGGRYVDTAVMAPVHPKLHKTPLLLSGPDVEEALAVTKALDMAAKAVPGGVGAASSNKMIRSVMMKGLEALVLECVLAGRKAGVDEAVLDSLDATYPGFGWKKRSAYMMERALTHGIRRAAEMREAALTVKELGFAGAMASATADWEQKIGELRLSAADAGAKDEQDYGALADLILKHLGSESVGD
jgi:3-hydroxyisobutyrate dehydrogenase-like beta-hydroxyacid dehydrogenase